MREGRVGAYNTFERDVYKSIYKNLYVTKEELKGKSRRGNIPDGRKIFAIAFRETTKLSHAEIGKKLNKDHSSVIAMVKSGFDLCKSDRVFEGYVREAISLNPINTLIENYHMDELMDCLSIQYGSVIDIERTKQKFADLIKWKKIEK